MWRVIPEVLPPAAPIVLVQPPMVHVADWFETLKCFFAHAFPSILSPSNSSLDRFSLAAIV
jgi:hypothetical protein